MPVLSMFSQKFLQKCHFFPKILLCKILGVGRVAFKENFGRGYFKPPPRLMYGQNNQRSKRKSGLKWLELILSFNERGHWRNFWLFWLKNAIFSENFWDPSGLSQICNKIFENFLTPPPLKIFLNPYPPPTIFGQAHVWFCLDSSALLQVFWLKSSLDQL